MMKRLLLGAALIGCCLTMNSHAMAARTLPQAPICITPAFEFRCFLDKLSVPGMLTVLAAGLGTYYAHKSFTAYANRHTTMLLNNTLVQEQTMLTKMKNYGIAAATCFTLASLFYYRSPLAAIISNIFSR